jgi:hypothetical protein
MVTKNYTKQAKALGIVYLGNMYTWENDELPMFHHDGIGSFVIEPGETLEQAFKRAKSRYKIQCRA